MDGLDLSRPLTARAGALAVERQFFCRGSIKMGSAGRADKFFFRRDGKGRWDLMTVWGSGAPQDGKKGDADY